MRADALSLGGRLVWGRVSRQKFAREWEGRVASQRMVIGRELAMLIVPAGLSGVSLSQRSEKPYALSYPAGERCRPADYHRSGKRIVSLLKGS